MKKLDPLDLYLYRENMKEEKKKREAENPEKSVGKEKEEGKSTNYLNLLIVLIVLIIFAVIAGKFMLNTRPAPQTYVQWQAEIDISICGEERQLPRTEGKYLGTKLINTRNDDKLHIEGMMEPGTNVTLGQFFDVIDVRFSREAIMDIQAGDECNGTPGEVKMYVNDVEVGDFRDYVIAPTKKAEDQVIRIEFS